MIQEKHKKSLVLQLNRKTQMLNIDSTLSFIIFSIFLIMISSFIQDLIVPYESSINYEIMYKDAASLSKTFITLDLTKEYLDNICNSEYSNIISTRGNYEAQALKLPAYDDIINASNQGIHIRRNNQIIELDISKNIKLRYKYI